MPPELHSRIRTPYATMLDLPPPFRQVTLREAGDAFAHAQSIAAEAGAGTLVWVGRFDLVEFALVLEPGRLAWPANADEHAPPPWLVFGAMIRTVTTTSGEPGLRPFAAALEEEGFDDLG